MTLLIPVFENMLGIFGNIKNPFNPSGLDVPAYDSSQSGEGLIIILNNLLKFTIVVAGLFTFWNIISAGYMFMSAGGEAKHIQKAWEKIYMSLIGLLITAGSFVLAMIFGWLIFGDFKTLISPQIFGP